ncbi:Jacalin-like lectin domain [Arabidopsis suecica]|uniref:Jacalin-like lectin domain n=1 Tax=Arabidopsis suecica TaxID=45249 RepID=A0A8T2DGD0_ARASU|nr:Jacalin-like lectin domain [Arabidopsis suecica]
MAQKLEAIGRGLQWDDSSDHDNVTKILVRGGREGIQYVKFDYVKSGQPQTGLIHGLSGRGGFTQTFEIDQKDEHLVSVEGYYDVTKGVIQALKFKTNKKTSEMIGYDDTGIKLSLEVKGKKIIGFHGYAETNLNSLGAYFTTTGPIGLNPQVGHIKLAYQGGGGGIPWDHGPNHNGVKRVSFIFDENEIRQWRVDYDDGGVIRQYEPINGYDMFEVKEYPTEYIISVECTYDDVIPRSGRRMIRSIMFKTSKGRVSPIFGYPAARKFVLENNGGALISFHGRVGAGIDALGAYFSSFIPSPPPPSPEKLQPEGGEAVGDPWDDGIFNGVREIHLEDGEGIALKFVYDKDVQVTELKVHGEPSGIGFNEFKLDYPSEYITTVEGFWDKTSGNERGVITRLRFTTNKQTFRPVGLESTTSFSLGKEGYKIVGFHGNSSTDKLHQLGVYVVPITRE